MAKQLPDFDLLVPWYPGKGRTAESVKQEIGGSINSPDIDDTCIVRLSKPLNYNDHKIPAWTEAFRTRKGRDKMWYGLRVKEFWPYMEKIYGPPTRYSKQPIDAKKFQGIRGIIGFRVRLQGRKRNRPLYAMGRFQPSLRRRRSRLFQDRDRGGVVGGGNHTHLCSGCLKDIEWFECLLIFLDLACFHR